MSTNSKTYFFLALLISGLFILRYIYSIYTHYSFGRIDLTKPYEATPTAFWTTKKPETSLYQLWSIWDSVYYLRIAAQGYDKGPFEISMAHNWASYPLYPLTVRIIGSILSTPSRQDLFYIGIVLSHVFFFLGLLFLYKLFEFLSLSKRVFYLAVGLLITFPSAYFFEQFYAESLLFFLSALFFYLFFKQKYLLTALVLSLALITKATAMALFVTYVIGMLIEHFPKRLLVGIYKTVIYSFIALIPLFLFFLHLESVTGEFFAVFKLQKAWQANYTIPLLGFFYTYVRANGFTVNPNHILTVIFLIGQVVFNCVCFFWFFLKRNSHTYFNKHFFLIVLSCLIYLAQLLSIASLDSIFRFASTNVAFFILASILLAKRNPLLISVIFVISAIIQSLFFEFYLTQIPMYAF